MVTITKVEAKLPDESTIVRPLTRARTQRKIKSFSVFSACVKEC